MARGAEDGVGPRANAGGRWSGAAVVAPLRRRRPYPPCTDMSCAAAAAPPRERWHEWFGSWIVPLAVMHGIMPAYTSGMNYMSSSTQTWSM